MPDLRCSSLPLFMKCAQSMNGVVNVKEYYPEATLGQAVHAALARHVAGMPVDVAAVASLFGADEGEVGFLFSQGYKAWEDMRPRVEDSPIHPERRLFWNWPWGDLTGAADVIIEHDGGRVLEIIDWKTGRRDADHREQVLGYCVLGLNHFPKAEVATSRVVWLRNLESEVYSLRRAEVEMWEERVASQVSNGGAYQPGAHCPNCPRKFECQARIDMSRAALAVIGGQRVDLRTMTADQQVTLYRKAKDVVDLGFRVIDQVKELAGEAPIQGLGVRLVMVEEARRALLPREAWPVLQQHLTDEQLAEAVKVSITAVQDAAAEGAPRGEGAGRKRALMAALEEAGAVTSSMVKKLTERRL